MTSIKSFKIPLSWHCVLVEEQIYPWHRKLQRHAKHRDLIEGPKIYRWVFKNQNGEIQAVYIGQSEKFQIRLSGYRTPTKTNPQDTDVIVRSEIDDWEKQGGTVELQFLDIAAFEVNGQVIDSSTESLGNHEVRVLLESIAIVTARSEPYRLINRLSKNVHRKDIDRVLKSNPLEVRAKVNQILDEQDKDS
jgi:hypothetical protein